jgi:UDP-GlcNAc:undecaprenyl-phosphate GlcNAc-1-phosphate transferase
MLWRSFYWPKTYLVVAVTAFVLCVALTPLAIYLLRRFNLLDEVKADKLHDRPVPRMGGVIMFIAFAVSVILPGYRSHAFNGVMLGALLCLMVGAADDLTGGKIPGIWKFAALIAATFIIEHFGVRLHLFKTQWLDTLALILWIVGVTSAFNGIDNMDGLASGVAAIVSSVYLVIALQVWLVFKTETSLSWFGMIAAGLLGANLGFLAFNFKPARIFMGDSGSFFLGFTLAALGVMGEWTENRIVSCTIPILLLGVPLFDFAYILIARIWKGQTRTISSVINYCSMDHISHRLTWIGMSQRQAVLFIYLICVTLGVTGVLLRNSVNYLDDALGFIQGLAVLIIVVVLMRTGYTLRHNETEKVQTPKHAGDKKK